MAADLFGAVGLLVAVGLSGAGTGSLVLVADLFVVVGKPLVAAGSPVVVADLFVVAGNPLVVADNPVVVADRVVVGTPVVQYRQVVGNQPAAGRLLVGGKPFVAVPLFVVLEGDLGQPGSRNIEQGGRQQACRVPNLANVDCLVG